MFWDRAAGLYDIFEKCYNGKVNDKLKKQVAEFIFPEDNVLECACGTGMLSIEIAKRAKSIIATDFSEGMLKKARKKCKDMDNISFDSCNIMELPFDDNSFDAVVAGNVIHLLEDPIAALKELIRVCKPNGRLIIPTYVNNENAGKPGLFVRTLEKSGADFKCQFDFNSYKAFFEEAGYKEAEYFLVEGKMPCAIAVLKKKPASIRKMEIEDYENVYELWMSCKGMGLNDIDDSRDGIERFLRKNPNTCLVAEFQDELVGVILVGTDGRRAYIYHTAVHPDFRHKKIAAKLVEEAEKAVEEEGISKIALVAFSHNELGNGFWESQGYSLRNDLSYRNKALKEMKRIDT